MRITVTIEMDRADAATKLATLAALFADETTQPDTGLVLAECAPIQTGDPVTTPEAPKRRRRKIDAPVTLAEDQAEQPAVADTEEVPAFEAIMAAAQVEAPETVHDYEVIRDKVRGLMLDTLGITWARKYVLPSHGSLSAVPDADLPALLVQAEADAAETTAAGAETWGEMVAARAAAVAEAVTA